MLLKRFAVPFSSNGYKLVSFNLDHPDRPHKMANPRECSKVNNFARFASGSLEQVWGQRETRVPDAARAVDRGGVFQHEQHVQTLKDLIALHLVRSLNYRDVHNRIFAKVYTEHRTALLTDKSDLLRLAVLQRRGLHLAGPQGLAAAADQRLFQKWIRGRVGSGRASHRSWLRVRRRHDGLEEGSGFRWRTADRGLTGGPCLHSDRRSCRRHHGRGGPGSQAVRR